MAIYDYEALTEPGEEENLEFDEGDLIEVCCDDGEHYFEYKFILLCVCFLDYRERW